MSIVAVIQARMTSKRFPGKALILLHGQPMLRHVIECAKGCPGIDSVMVATSDRTEDDPLESYLHSIGVQCFRGSLEDVFLRFQQCGVSLTAARWILRLCADSPLLSREVIAEVCRHKDGPWDVVTTRYAPPFPKGQNAELIRRETLMAVNHLELTIEEREHVTPYFYRNRNRFLIGNAASVALPDVQGGFAVDTPADLARLESIASTKKPWEWVRDPP